MIVDSSAVVAILLQEPDHERLLDALLSDGSPGMSAATLLETSIVLAARLRRDPHVLLTQFVHDAGIRVIAFDEAHSAAALDAFLRYGKGRHPASLNFGDCISYATAALAGQPLLYVGEDFAHTDLSGG